MIFNGAQLALSTSLAGAAYLATGGPIGGVDGSHFPGIALPLAVASATYFVTNTSFVAGMVSLVRRVRFSEVWSMNFLSIAGSTVAFAVLGVLLATLYLEMGLWAIIFVLVPLIVARRALAAAIVMDQAYESTVRSLIRAIEAKDAYTSGHAGRVSQIAEMIARRYGLPERKVRALRIAAIMHDVGKLVVSTRVLQKPGKLTEDEYEHMRDHPQYGCEIVEEIDFLREGDAIDAVRHHHERMDGRGYPDGIAGDEIPLTARIVMVADAFDAMTSTRSYRPAKPVEKALGELRRCEGTQFDPEVLAALERAIALEGWEPSPEAFEGEKTARPEVGVHAVHA
jgi:HD superfamily phosphohydrolase YqeK